MRIYADTSFLVSLYFPDVHSDKASRWMKHEAQALPLTPLHRHELRNAIRLAVWRKLVDAANEREILRLIDADVKEGFLAHQPVTWTAAFSEAERIGERLTREIGLRSIDLLHLGVASWLGVTEFLTFDATQRKAAIAAGLKCRV